MRRRLGSASALSTWTNWRSSIIDTFEYVMPKTSKVKTGYSGAMRWLLVLALCGFDRAPQRAGAVLRAGAQPGGHQALRLQRRLRRRQLQRDPGVLAGRHSAGADRDRRRGDSPALFEGQRALPGWPFALGRREDSLR